MSTFHTLYKNLAQKKNSLQMFNLMYSGSFISGLFSIIKLVIESYKLQKMVIKNLDIHINGF